MAGYIPDDIVERIKAESDIVSVVSMFVNLKKSGKDYKGLCPFHQEKTPSFFVIPGKGFYHCFGCGAGGNAVNFIMAHERLDYPDALRYLANKAGIAIPETKAKKSDNDILFDALSLAGSFYAKSLREPQIGAGALEYVRGRDIKSAAIETFGIGYAPGGWDGLIKASIAQNVQPSILERVGLAIKREGYYDRFRNRLMIPIRAMAGRIVGFGGRVLPGDDGPKYINSPETEIYKKGKILFGLDLSKDHIRDKNEAIVVEGYFDLISLYQNGIKNVVAVSGTGFTQDQASLLARFCERIVLLYDSDSAGIKAAFRACGVLYNSGMEPGLIRLPKGHDPDTFVRVNGPKALLKMVSEATDVVDFIQTGLPGNFASQSLPRQEKIIRALSEMADLVADPLRHNLLIKRISDKFDLPAGTFENRPSGGQRNREINLASDLKALGREKPERDFLSLLISNPEMISQYAEIEASLFTDDDNAKLFELLCHLHDEGKLINIINLFDSVQDENMRRKLTQIAIIDHSEHDVEKMLQDYLNDFKLRKINKRREELKNLISEADKQADIEKANQLTRERPNLQIRGGKE
jgi:DNA primase